MDEITIDVKCVGNNGSVFVTVRRGSEALAADTVNILKKKDRQAFVEGICSTWTAIGRDELERLLIQEAARMASSGNGDGAATGDGEEIDCSSIVRPERFITPEVSGLAVPLAINRNGTTDRIWKLYVRWADGRREAVPLPPYLDLPNKQRLWIHPTPAEPPSDMLPRWSRKSRDAWLKTGKTPNPADLFWRLCDHIDKHIDLPSDHATGTKLTLVLWTILTYCYHAWSAVPYLYVNGSLNSGKSRLFSILSQLAFRPQESSNMTAASLFRTLHSKGGVLLLDEAERLKHTQSTDVKELLSILLAGYQRGRQATRMEKVGDTYQTMAFDVYGPKAVACIAGLPPALASRCINVRTFRAAPGSKASKRRINVGDVCWQEIRDDLHILALEYGAKWLELSERFDICQEISNRNFELWQPLLALAQWLESCGVDGLLTQVRGHALAAIEIGQEETVPDTDEILLCILADAQRRGERITAGRILEIALGQEPSVFRNWFPRTVASRLKLYGIPLPHKSGSRREYRDLPTEVFLKIQSHYSLDLGFPRNENQPLTHLPASSLSSQPSPSSPTVS